MKRSGTMARRDAALTAILLLTSALLACTSERGADTAASGETSPPAATGPTAGEFTEADITPGMIALGDSIFEGQAAGGICYTCHGPDAKGGQLGPDLTDAQWLNGDGSLSFVATTIRNGVPQPKQHPGPMPAFGAALGDENVRAVSAYVYSLSHPGAGG